MKHILFLVLLLFSLLSQSAEDFIDYGDQVHITMKEDEEVFFEGEVSTNGFITLPYLGAIQIHNMTEKQAESTLKKALEVDLYQKATMSVVVVKKAIGYVYIYGAVEEPGKVELPPEGQIHALQAIAEVGGLSKWGDPNKAYVLIKMPGSEEIIRKELNLEEAYNNLASSYNIELSKDDIIVIPSLAEGAVAPGSVEVMVSGKVEEPGIVVFEPGEYPTVVRAILKAGNFNKFADKRKVRIIRRSNGETQIINVNIEKLLEDGEIDKDIQLFSGDLIVIDETWI